MSKNIKNMSEFDTFACKHNLLSSWILVSVFAIGELDDDSYPRFHYHAQANQIAVSKIKRNNLSRVEITFNF